MPTGDGHPHGAPAGPVRDLPRWHRRSRWGNVRSPADLCGTVGLRCHGSPARPPLRPGGARGPPLPRLRGTKGVNAPRRCGALGCAQPGRPTRTPSSSHHTYLPRPPSYERGCRPRTSHRPAPGRALSRHPGPAPKGRAAAARAPRSREVTHRSRHAGRKWREQALPPCFTTRSLGVRGSAPTPSNPAGDRSRLLPGEAPEAPPPCKRPRFWSRHATTLDRAPSAGPSADRPRSPAGRGPVRRGGPSRGGHRVARDGNGGGHLDRASAVAQRDHHPGRPRAETAHRRRRSRRRHGQAVHHREVRHRPRLPPGHRSGRTPAHRHHVGRGRIGQRARSARYRPPARLRRQPERVPGVHGTARRRGHPRPLPARRVPPGGPALPGTRRVQQPQRRPAPRSAPTATCTGASATAAAPGTPSAPANGWTPCWARSCGST
ncbi:hypothetical protein SHIRM173S_12112 [Streptomyces hirsutus]